MEYIKIWDNVPFYNEKYVKENPENENTPSLTPFLCENSEKSPCILVVPGGGYTHRATEKKIKVAKVLRQWGFSAFVLNYRVTPYIHPIELNDCKRAIRFLRHNCDKYGIDKEKISVIGFSAGAHLAALSVLTDNEYDFEISDEIDKENISVHSLALCYPVVTLYGEYSHKGSGDNLLGDNKELKKKLSLQNMDVSKLPPVFMWHTAEDKSVPVQNSMMFAEILKKNDIPFEYHIFNKGKHGSALAEDIPLTSQWVGLYKNFLSNF